MRCRLAQLSRHASDDSIRGLTQVAKLSPPTSRAISKENIHAVNTKNGSNGNNEQLAMVVLNNGQGSSNGSVVKAEKMDEIRPFNANVRVQVSHV